jgi:hypothetical protein
MRPLSDNPGAIRRRRYRERQAIGAKVVSIEVDPELIEALIELGEIAPGQADDRHAIAEAITDILGRTLTATRAEAENRSSCASTSRDGEEIRGTRPGVDSGCAIVGSK